MLTRSPRRPLAYCETILPLENARHQEDVLFLQTLLDRDILDYNHYFLYRNTRNAETRIVGNPFATITINAGEVSLSLAGTGQIQSKPVDSDPLKQVEQLLENVPLPEAVAYGYISFVLVHSYYEYGKTKSFDMPLLSFIVPKIEIRLTTHAVHIRSVDPLIIQDIIEAWQDIQELPIPALPQTTPFQIATEDRSWYEATVHRFTEAIHADTSHDGPYQRMFLSRKVEVPGQMDVIGTYTRIQADTPDCSYCFQFGSNAVVGTSSETLLEAHAYGYIKTHSLTRTSWRGKDHDEDTRLQTQLYISRKQQVEHIISILGAQHEMRSVCSQGSVSIHDIAHIQKYHSVQHLASQLTGRLAADKTVWDAIRTVFPGVTVSGISKSTAIAWIDRLEPAIRGIYAGGVGYVSRDGTADIAIAVRNFIQQGQTVSLQAGAEIVADSKLAYEYEETWHEMKEMWSCYVQNSKQDDWHFRLLNGG